MARLVHVTFKFTSMVGPQLLEVHCLHCMISVARWECGDNFVTCRAVSGSVASLSLQLIPSHSIQRIRIYNEPKHAFVDVLTRVFRLVGCSDPLDVETFCK